MISRLLELLGAWTPFTRAQPLPDPPAVRMAPVTRVMTIAERAEWIAEGFTCFRPGCGREATHIKTVGSDFRCCQMHAAMIEYNTRAQAAGAQIIQADVWERQYLAEHPDFDRSYA